MTISKQLEKINISIKLVDSYNILSHSLNKLCKTFDTYVKKGVFPYSFVTQNTLISKGEIPLYEYYKGITKEEYLKIKDDLGS
jgi:hypothetical protein